MDIIRLEDRFSILLYFVHRIAAIIIFIACVGMRFNIM